MKVVSVNLSSDKPNRQPDRQIDLALVLYKLCVQLPEPNQEFYNIFDQLKSSSITKTPQQKITLSPGGVVGDRHYMPDVKIYEDGVFYNLSSYKQVSLMSKERYTELNQFYNKDVQAGEFGENIQFEGLASIEKLSQGTVIQLGDTAQVKIMHLRTFCYKFPLALFSNPKDYFTWKKNSFNQFIGRIGVTGQVIKSGTVEPGDAITVVYTPSEYVDLRYFDHLVDGVASRTPCDPPTNYYHCNR